MDRGRQLVFIANAEQWTWTVSVAAMKLKRVFISLEVLAVRVFIVEGEMLQTRSGTGHAFLCAAAA